MARLQHLASIHGSAEDWVIDGVLSHLSLLWGKPGLGKSFVAISMAASVGSGRPWLGRKVQEGRVVYVVGEGGAEAVARRLRAALDEWRVDPSADPVPIDLVTPGVDLTAGSDELRELVGEDPPKLIVIDTLNRCFVGDENKQEFMGRFVRSLDLLREAYPGCCVLVVHHANRNEEVRGSSVLTGAVDVNWRLVRRKAESKVRAGDRFYTMVPDKLRERDVDGAHLRFIMRKVECTDEDGEPELDTFGDVQTSLIVKPDPKDIECAKTVLKAARILLEKRATFSYIDWRCLTGMDKADFDAAVSIIITYPGQWGGVEHLGGGVYGVRAKEEV